MNKTDRTTAFEGGPCIPGAYSGDNVSVFTEKVTGGTISSPKIEGTDPVRVFVPGKSDPVEAEVTFRLSEDDVTKYMNIMSITPQDKNPVLYWHQVAMDAVKSAESAQKREKRAEALRERAERELDTMTSGLVERTADKRALIPLDMSRLIDMVATGAIDLNVSLFISKGKENA